MNSFQTTRRSFLTSSAAAAGLLAVPGLSLADEQRTADQLIRGKDRRLLVLKPYPAVLETPLPLLAEQKLTPNSLLFVRNNAQPKTAATLAPLKDTEWTVRLTGYLNKSATVRLRELQSMPQTSVEMVLQCSGNGRSLFSKAAQTSGTQWGRGGMGNVKFSGVRLSTVLDRLGVEPADAVQFVNASGRDEPLPDKEPFLHSLPVDEVLNNSLLALDLNGGPIPAIHGGPVRLVTPGVFGTMHIKWLSDLKFVSSESTNYNHVPRYRVPRKPIKPGTEYDFTLANSNYNWKLKTKSVLLSPNDGDAVKAGNVSLKGVAFTDGDAAITSVLISTDRGASWQAARLAPSDSRYGWTQFDLTVPLKAGRQSLWCMATDSLGRSQPVDGSVAWNPRGYEWNGVEKVEVVVAG